MRLVLYIAIGFILWRIVRALMRKAPPERQIPRETVRNEQVEMPRGPEIDYSRVRDAEWRERESTGRDSSESPKREHPDDAGERRDSHPTGKP